MRPQWWGLGGGRCGCGGGIGGGDDGGGSDVGSGRGIC